MTNNSKETIDYSHFESLYPENAREKEIGSLLSYIKGGNAAQLISLPGVGRSNVLGLLSYNRAVRTHHLGDNQKWFHFVLANFSEMRKRPLTDVLKFLFLTLADSLRERQLEKEHEVVYSLFKDSLALNDELVLFQGLKKAMDYLAIEKELTIVYLFDRFEEYIPMLTPEFFTNLRVLRNHAKYRFSFILSLNRPLEDIVEPSLFADYYEFLAGHSVYLPFFDKTTFDFRTSYIEKVTGKTLDEQMKKQILVLTSGHGKLTRIAVEAVLASKDVILERSDRILGSYQSAKASLQDDKKNNLSSFVLSQKTIQGALYEIWQSLMPHEQKFLFTVILGTNIMRTPESMAKDSGQARMTTEEHQYLTNVGLIKNGQITIPLFTAFIKQHKEKLTMQQLSNEAITYDGETNDIKKGTLSLTDKLTSREFRLLQFLLQNKDRVIQREEIIQAVWKEQASVAGVTEQALDQLIFRLRHKIEEDPNNPKHLQTVKGRGVRFYSQGIVSV